MVRCGIHFTIHRQMMLSTHFEEYEKGEAMHSSVQSLFDTGVPNSDGLFLGYFHPTSPTLLHCAGGRWK